MRMTKGVPMPIPLVIVAGLARRQAAAGATRLMRAEAGSVPLHPDLRGIAECFVVRRQKYGHREDVAFLQLEHGCVSCTLREDLLPLVTELAGRPGVTRIVVHLD